MNIETHFELNKRAAKVEKLEEENENLRHRVKFLEGVIKEKSDEINTAYLEIRELYQVNKHLKQHIKEHDMHGV